MISVYALDGCACKSVSVCKICFADIFFFCLFVQRCTTIVPVHAPQTKQKKKKNETACSNRAVHEFLVHECVVLVISARQSILFNENIFVPPPRMLMLLLLLLLLYCTIQAATVARDPWEMNQTNVE